MSQDDLVTCYSITLVITSTSFWSGSRLDTKHCHWHWQQSVQADVINNDLQSSLHKTLTIFGINLMISCVDASKCNITYLTANFDCFVWIRLILNFCPVFHYTLLTWHPKLCIACYHHAFHGSARKLYQGQITSFLPKVWPAWCVCDVTGYRG